MKKFYLLAAFVLAALCLSSCKKDDGGSSTSSVYQTYWEGSTTVTYKSGSSVTQLTYTLQLYFKTETLAVCQYTMGVLRDYYTADYKMTSDKTVICTVQSTAGDSYEEKGTLSSDGNTMVYHTKILTDDDSSWTDITMTKKDLPTE